MNGKKEKSDRERAKKKRENDQQQYGREKKMSDQ